MGSYFYSLHVKVVWIVEIILQLILTILTIIGVKLAVTGVDIFTRYSSSGMQNSAPGSAIPDEVVSGATGLLITIAVILVVYRLFAIWLVFWVFSGGQKENPSRLTTWYIIESVLFSLWLIFVFALLVIRLPWFFVIFALIYVVYRIYSIHVVRCHANEIRLNPNLPINANYP